MHDIDEELIRCKDRTHQTIPQLVTCGFMWLLWLLEKK